MESAYLCDAGFHGIVYPPALVQALASRNPIVAANFGVHRESGKWLAD
jgi:hypothetical protein